MLIAPGLWLASPKNGNISNGGLETIGDFALRLFKLGVYRRVGNSQKVAIGGHFLNFPLNNLQLSDCLADLGGFELLYYHFKKCL